MKFKTNPNLGTRKVHFPYVGDVDVKDGIVTIPKEHVEDIQKADFGIKLIPVSEEDGHPENEDALKKQQEEIEERNRIASGIQESGEYVPPQEEVKSSSEVDDSDLEDALTKEDIMKMRVKDLMEMADELVKNGAMTDEMRSTFETVNKQEKINIISSILL